MKVGSPPRKVFDVGFRGTFDLIDESSGSTIRSNADAINIIVKATATDAVLILWQAAFSLGVMATMAYALSPDLQARYSGPLDLFQHGGHSFITATLWYAVSFPRWDCYRVEHDPVYVAYVAPPDSNELAPILGLMLIVLIILIIVAVAIGVAASKKKRRGQMPR